MAAAAATVVVVGYILADRTQVAPADKTADMPAAVVVALPLDLYLGPYLDPAGHSSKKS